MVSLNRILSLCFVLGSTGVFAQLSQFKVVYRFNGTLAPEVVTGSGFVSADNAITGGNYLKNIAFVANGSDSVLSADVVNNNATNFLNTYIRCDLRVRGPESVRITSISVRQKANDEAPSNLFRIGCNKNKITPTTTDVNQCGSNAALSASFSVSTFEPGSAIATAASPQILSAFICARGSSSTTVNWMVDEIIIEGIAFNGSAPNIVVVSAEPKQQMRFGIDAERLWYWRSSLKDQLASLAVKEMQSDYVRVAINCAYEREEGVKNSAAYDQIIEMMTAMKKANPAIKIFASPRPLAEAYTKAEELSLWGGDVPWSPYPSWILPFKANGTNTDGTTKWNEQPLNVSKLLRYYADYLNLMKSKGFDIDYLDLTNEKNVITPAITKIIKDSLPLRLNPGVQLPLFVAPSTWSRQQGTDWLKSVNTAKGENMAFDVASTHNTDLAGTAAAFSSAANALGKEVWNTELHGWVGIDSRDEILNSASLWEQIRGGFQGIDSWLFFGPLNGKDHTMIWAGTTQIVKSTKYEIFKKVVNHANRGFYLNCNELGSECTTAAFTRDSVITVWVLNSAALPIANAAILLSRCNILGRTIETTRWHASLPRAGLLSKTTATAENFFNCTIDSASLYCFKVDLKQNPLSISKNDAPGSAIICYPNPTTGKVFLQGYSNKSDVQCNVYNMLGKLVLTDKIKTNHAIDLSPLQNGPYLLQWVTNDKIYSRKVRLIK